MSQDAGLASGSVFPLGTTTNTFTVSDGAGNTASCSFNVTVNDTENPSIVCPGDIVANNDAGNCSAVVTYTPPTGIDNCPGASTAQTTGLGSGATFPVGTTVEAYQVTDGAGNMANCSFNITVNDAEDPTIVCPADITVGNDAGQCSAVVSYTAPTGTDNCPGATTALSSGLGSGGTFPVGTSVETYTVTDAAGNT
ncbi:MAG: HYR domain-containing protein, partial [Saprospiraceae bacterium]|nr:HYR domain-containing protein [Saprospiraceae bacterium]